jgi:amidase
MSTAHAVTRSVRDSAALLDVVQGADLGAPYVAPAPARPYLEEVGAPPGRLRIAVQTTSWNGSETHPDCVAAAEDAARVGQELGHEVVRETLSIDAALFGRASQVIIVEPARGGTGALAELGRELRDDDLSRRRVMFRPQPAWSGRYARSTRVIHASAAGCRFLVGHDLILTPTLARRRSRSR